MITLQTPVSVAKTVQPASAAPANPAAADADTALVGNAAAAPSLFAFLLAQQTAAADPGKGLAPALASAEEEAATEAGAGDAAASTAWMWLNTGLPRETTGLAAPAAAPTTSATELDATAGPGGPVASPPGSGGGKDGTTATLNEARPEQPAPTVRKAASEDFATVMSAVNEAPVHARPVEMQANAIAGPQAPPAPAPKVAAVEVPIESRVGTPRWTRDISQSVTMLVQARTSVAELRLTPADMGPIQIRIDFSEAQPSVAISVQQADTRNALDAALPRLREMMAESGINLGGAGVEQHANPGDAPGGEARFARNGREDATQLEKPAADPLLPVARAISLDQLVDTYA